jgi:hypothetical protein
MLASLYRIDRKSNKYYLRIVYYLISVCVNNAWILHKENRPEKQFILRDFIKEVSFSLMKANEPVKQFNFQKKINDLSTNDDVATVTKSLPAMNLEPPTELILSRPTMKERYVECVKKTLLFFAENLVFS